MERPAHQSDAGWLSTLLNEHPKARCAIRGPVYQDRAWVVSYTDQEGDSTDGKGPTLDHAIRNLRRKL